MINIETPRLLIRSYDYGDEDSIVDLIVSNREHLKDVLSDWVYEIETKDQAKLFIKKMKVGLALKNMFALGVWLKEEQKLIGEIVFFKVDWKVLKMEIGSYIDYNYQGRGLVTEARLKCVEVFFDKYQLKKIESVCHIDNTAIHKVNLKCGFTIESRKDAYLTFAFQNSDSQ